MKIDVANITPTEDPTRWSVTDFSNRMTFLQEDELAYRLTDEELRRELDRE